MWQKVKIYGVNIAIPLAVGGLSAFLTRNSMDIYEKINQPFLAPPAWLFPVVWTVLYGLMGISAAQIASFPDGKQRSRALNIFVIQLAVNFFWSLIFFNAQAYESAFLWLVLLWILVFAMILFFYKLDRLAAVLQIPYFLWVSFAGYLSYMVWQLNS